jgi:hypothetical protein
MVPFRVFDRENKDWWIVLNYHPGAGPDGAGNYLVAREDDEDNERDGQMQLIPAAELSRFRLVDFLEEQEGYPE